MRRSPLVPIAAFTVGALLVILGALALPRARRVAAPPSRVADAVSPAGSARARAMRAAYLARLDTLDLAVAALAGAARGKDRDAAVAAFRAARIAYKRVEVLAEYYTPVTARAMNGPVLDRVEEDEPSVVVHPTGFQVAEAALFPAAAADWRATLAREGAILRQNVVRLRAIALETEPTDGHAFEAARQELARVATLGLAGFDAGLSGDAAPEAAAAIRGVRAALLPWRDVRRGRAAWDTLDARLERAAAWLDARADFERLDRLAFITDGATPAMRALQEARAALGVALPPGRRVWVEGAATPWEVGALDARAYAPGYAPAATPAIVALGGALFFDPALSGDGSRSCATCHQPRRAFTDGLARRAALGGAGATGGRNTPTVLNAGLQPASFYDQRVAYLEDQITDVLGNRAEMAHSAEGAADVLRRQGRYADRFAVAFAVSPDSAVTALRLRLALAAYMRSLQALESRFDRALRGDSAALTAAERHGFTVFMGKGKCGTCHFAPLLNGATPPAFTDAEPEVIGVPAHGAALDADVGRFAVDHVALHRYAFRTPALRNVALTAPYMHNGAFRTLEEVVDFYDRGGGAGGARLPNRTLPADSLRLTRGERRDLVAFLRALTDTTSWTAP